MFETRAVTNKNPLQHTARYNSVRAPLPTSKGTCMKRSNKTCLLIADSKEFIVKKEAKLATAPKFETAEPASAVESSFYLPSKTNGYELLNSPLMFSKWWFSYPSWFIMNSHLYSVTHAKTAVCVLMLLEQQALNHTWRAFYLLRAWGLIPLTCQNLVSILSWGIHCCVNHTQPEFQMWLLREYWRMI